MEILTPEARAMVIGMLSAQDDLTLATIRPDGYPQATTVSFANDGLTIYIGIGMDSQKAHNICHSDKVSLALTPPYQDWMHIRALSMAGRAAVVVNGDEQMRVSTLMVARYPQLREMMATPGPQPWSGNMALLRITPEVISVLDYTRGFGHTDLYRVTP
jgi:nitroimidazol reductase NimA-like FMN-containing flavoprotein (pyridoxamine 5'-phosphate oxidase superfamily)